MLHEDSQELHRPLLLGSRKQEMYIFCPIYVTTAKIAWIWRKLNYVFGATDNGVQLLP